MNTLTVPSSLNWIFLLLAGNNWPKGDEGQLWAMADELEALGPDVTGVGEEFTDLANQLGKVVGGSVGRGYVKYGQQLAGFDADFNQGTAALVKALRAQAVNLQNSKYGMLIEVAFFGAEILWALGDPFTAPLVPEFIVAGREAVERLLERYLGRAAEFVAAAIDEGIEEAFQDLLAQLIQVMQGYKKGIDLSSTLTSAALGAGGGAFAHSLHKGLTKYGPPKVAHGIVGAMGVEATTELGIGLVTLPMGGDAGDLGWSVLSGGFTGGASHVAHQVHHGDHGDVPHIPDMPKPPDPLDVKDLVDPNDGQSVHSGKEPSDKNTVAPGNPPSSKNPTGPGPSSSEPAAPRPSSSRESTDTDSMELTGSPSTVATSLPSTSDDLLPGFEPGVVNQSQQTGDGSRWTSQVPLARAAVDGEPNRTDLLTSAGAIVAMHHSPPAVDRTAMSTAQQEHVTRYQDATYLVANHLRTGTTAGATELSQTLAKEWNTGRTTGGAPPGGSQPGGQQTPTSTGQSSSNTSTTSQPTQVQTARPGPSNSPAPSESSASRPSDQQIPTSTAGPSPVTTPTSATLQPARSEPSTAGPSPVTTTTPATSQPTRSEPSSTPAPVQQTGSRPSGQPTPTSTGGPEPSITPATAEHGDIGLVSSIPSTVEPSSVEQTTGLSSTQPVPVRPNGERATEPPSIEPPSTVSRPTEPAGALPSVEPVAAPDPRSGDLGLETRAPAMAGITTQEPAAVPPSSTPVEQASPDILPMREPVRLVTLASEGRLDASDVDTIDWWVADDRVATGRAGMVVWGRDRDRVRGASVLVHEHITRQFPDLAPSTVDDMVRTRVDQEAPARAVLTLQPTAQPSVTITGVDPDETVMVDLAGGWQLVTSLPTTDPAWQPVVDRLRTPPPTDEGRPRRWVATLSGVGPDSRHAADIVRARLSSEFGETVRIDVEAPPAEAGTSQSGKGKAKVARTQVEIRFTSEWAPPEIRLVPNTPPNTVGGPTAAFIMELQARLDMATQLGRNRELSEPGSPAAAALRTYTDTVRDAILAASQGTGYDTRDSRTALLSQLDSQLDAADFTALLFEQHEAMDRIDQQLDDDARQEWHSAVQRLVRLSATGALASARINRHDRTGAISDAADQRLLNAEQSAFDIVEDFSRSGGELTHDLINGLNATLAALEDVVAENRQEADQAYGEIEKTSTIPSDDPRLLQAGPPPDVSTQEVAPGTPLTPEKLSDMRDEADKFEPPVWLTGTPATIGPDTFAFARPFDGGLPAAGVPALIIAIQDHFRSLGPVHLRDEVAQGLSGMLSEYRLVVQLGQAVGDRLTTVIHTSDGPYVATLHIQPSHPEPLTDIHGDVRNDNEAAWLPKGRKEVRTRNNQSYQLNVTTNESTTDNVSVGYAPSYAAHVVNAVVSGIVPSLNLSVPLVNTTRTHSATSQLINNGYTKGSRFRNVVYLYDADFDITLDKLTAARPEPQPDTALPGPGQDVVLPGPVQEAAPPRQTHGFVPKALTGLSSVSTLQRAGRPQRDEETKQANALWNSQPRTELPLAGNLPEGQIDRLGPVVRLPLNVVTEAVVGVGELREAALDIAPADLLADPHAMTGLVDFLKVQSVMAGLNRDARIDGQHSPRLFVANKAGVSKSYRYALSVDLHEPRIIGSTDTFTRMDFEDTDVLSVNESVSFNDSAGATVTIAGGGEVGPSLSASGSRSVSQARNVGVGTTVVHKLKYTAEPSVVVELKAVARVTNVHNPAERSRPVLMTVWMRMHTSDLGSVTFGTQDVPQPDATEPIEGNGADDVPETGGSVAARPDLVPDASSTHYQAPSVTHASAQTHPSATADIRTYQEKVAPSLTDPHAHERNGSDRDTLRPEPPMSPDDDQVHSISLFRAPTPDSARAHADTHYLPPAIWDRWLPPNSKVSHLDQTAATRVLPEATALINRRFPGYLGPAGPEVGTEVAGYFDNEAKLRNNLNFGALTKLFHKLVNGSHQFELSIPGILPKRHLVVRLTARTDLGAMKYVRTQPGQMEVYYGSDAGFGNTTTRTSGVSGNLGMGGQAVEHGPVGHLTGFNLNGNVGLAGSTSDTYASGFSASGGQGGGSDYLVEFEGDVTFQVEVYERRAAEPDVPPMPGAPGPDTGRHVPTTLPHEGTEGARPEITAGDVGRNTIPLEDMGQQPEGSPDAVQENGEHADRVRAPEMPGGLDVDDPADALQTADPGDPDQAADPAEVVRVVDPAGPFTLDEPILVTTRLLTTRDIIQVRTAAGTRPMLTTLDSNKYGRGADLRWTPDRTPELTSPFLPGSALAMVHTDPLLSDILAGFRALGVTSVPFAVYDKLSTLVGGLGTRVRDFEGTAALLWHGVLESGALTDTGYEVSVSATVLSLTSLGLTPRAYQYQVGGNTAGLSQSVSTQSWVPSARLGASIGTALTGPGHPDLDTANLLAISPGYTYSGGVTDSVSEGASGGISRVDINIGEMVWATGDVRFDVRVSVAQNQSRPQLSVQPIVALLPVEAAEKLKLVPKAATDQPPAAIDGPGPHTGSDSQQADKRNDDHTAVAQVDRTDVTSLFPPAHVENGDGFGYSVLLDHSDFRDFRQDVLRTVRTDLGSSVATIVDDQLGRLLGSRNVTRGVLEDLMAGMEIVVPSRKLGGLVNGTVHISLNATFHNPVNGGLTTASHVLERSHTADKTATRSFGASRSHNLALDLTFVHPRHQSVVREHDADLIVSVNSQSGISHSDSLVLQDSLGLLAVTQVVRFRYDVDMEVKVRVDYAPSMLVNLLTGDLIRSRSVESTTTLGPGRSSLVLGFPEEVTEREQPRLRPPLTPGVPRDVLAHEAHQHRGMLRRAFLEDAEIDSDTFGGLRQFRTDAKAGLFPESLTDRVLGPPTSWQTNRAHLKDTINTAASLDFLVKNFVELATGSMSHRNVLPGVAWDLPGEITFSIELADLEKVRSRVSPNPEVGGLVKDFQQSGSTVRSTPSHSANLTVTGGYRPVFAPFHDDPATVRRQGDTTGHQVRAAMQPISHATSVSVAGPSTSLQRGNKTTKRSHDLYVATITYRMSWQETGSDMARVVAVEVPQGTRLWIPSEQSDLFAPPDVQPPAIVEGLADTGTDEPTVQPTEDGQPQPVESAVDAPVSDQPPETAESTSEQEQGTDVVRRGTHPPRDISLAVGADRLGGYQRAASVYLSQPGRLRTGEQEHQLRDQVAVTMAWANVDLDLMRGDVTDLLTAGLRRLPEVPGTAYRDEPLTDAMTPGTPYVMSGHQLAQTDRPSPGNATTVLRLEHRSGRSLAGLTESSGNRIAIPEGTRFVVRSVGDSEIVLSEVDSAEPEPTGVEPSRAERVATARRLVEAAPDHDDLLRDAGSIVAQHHRPPPSNREDLSAADQARLTDNENALYLVADELRTGTRESAEELSQSLAQEWNNRRVTGGAPPGGARPSDRNTSSNAGPSRPSRPHVSTGELLPGFPTTQELGDDGVILFSNPGTTVDDADPSVVAILGGIASRVVNDQVITVSGSNSDADLVHGVADLVRQMVAAHRTGATGANVSQAQVRGVVLVDLSDGEPGQTIVAIQQPDQPETPHAGRQGTTPSTQQNVVARLRTALRAAGDHPRRLGALLRGPVRVDHQPPVRSGKGKGTARTTEEVDPDRVENQPDARRVPVRRNVPEDPDTGPRAGDRGVDTTEVGPPGPVAAHPLTVDNVRDDLVLVTVSPGWQRMTTSALDTALGGLTARLNTPPPTGGAPRRWLVTISALGPDGENAARRVQRRLGHQFRVERDAPTGGQTREFRTRLERDAAVSGGVFIRLETEPVPTGSEPTSSDSSAVHNITTLDPEGNPAISYTAVGSGRVVTLELLAHRDVAQEMGKRRAFGAEGSRAAAAVRAYENAVEDGLLLATDDRSTSESLARALSRVDQRLAEANAALARDWLDDDLSQVRISQIDSAAVQELQRGVDRLTTQVHGAVLASVRLGLFLTQETPGVADALQRAERTIQQAANGVRTATQDVDVPLSDDLMDGVRLALEESDDAVAALQWHAEWARAGIEKARFVGPPDPVTPPEPDKVEFADQRDEPGDYDPPVWLTGDHPVVGPDTFALARSVDTLTGLPDDVESPLIREIHEQFDSLARDLPGVRDAIMDGLRNTLNEDRLVSEMTQLVGDQLTTVISTSGGPYVATIHIRPTQPVPLTDIDGRILPYRTNVWLPAGRDQVRTRNNQGYQLNVTTNESTTDNVGLAYAGSYAAHVVNAIVSSVAPSLSLAVPLANATRTHSTTSLLANNGFTKGSRFRNVVFQYTADFTVTLGRLGARPATANGSTRGALTGLSSLPTLQRKDEPEDPGGEAAGLLGPAFDALRTGPQWQDVTRALTEDELDDFGPAVELPLNVVTEAVVGVGELRSAALSVAPEAVLNDPGATAGLADFLRVHSVMAGLNRDARFDRQHSPVLYTVNRTGGSTPHAFVLSATLHGPKVIGSIDDFTRMDFEDTEVLSVNESLSFSDSAGVTVGLGGGGLAGPSASASGSRSISQARSAGVGTTVVHKLKFTDEPSVVVELKVIARVTSLHNPASPSRPVLMTVWMRMHVSDVVQLGVTRGPGLAGWLGQQGRLPDAAPSMGDEHVGSIMSHPEATSIAPSNTRSGHHSLSTYQAKLRGLSRGSASGRDPSSASFSDAGRSISTHTDPARDNQQYPFDTYDHAVWDYRPPAIWDSWLPPNSKVSYLDPEAALRVLPETADFINQRFPGYLPRTGTALNLDSVGYLGNVTKLRNNLNYSGLIKLFHTAVNGGHMFLLSSPGGRQDRYLVVRLTATIDLPAMNPVRAQQGQMEVFYGSDAGFGNTITRTAGGSFTVGLGGQPVRKPPLAHLTGFGLTVAGGASGARSNTYGSGFSGSGGQGGGSDHLVEFRGTASFHVDVYEMHTINELDEPDEPVPGAYDSREALATITEEATGSGVTVSLGGSDEAIEMRSIRPPQEEGPANPPGLPVPPNTTVRHASLPNPIAVTTNLLTTRDIVQVDTGSEYVPMLGMMNPGEHGRGIDRTWKSITEPTENPESPATQEGPVDPADPATSEGSVDQNEPVAPVMPGGLVEPDGPEGPVEGPLAPVILEPTMIPGSALFMVRTDQLLFNILAGFEDLGVRSLPFPVHEKLSALARGIGARVRDFEGEPVLLWRGVSHSGLFADTEYEVLVGARVRRLVSLGATSSAYQYQFGGATGAITHSRTTQAYAPTGRFGFAAGAALGDGHKATTNSLVLSPTYAYSGAVSRGTSSSRSGGTGRVDINIGDMVWANGETEFTVIVRTSNHSNLAGSWRQRESRPQQRMVQTLTLLPKTAAGGFGLVPAPSTQQPPAALDRSDPHTGSGTSGNGRNGTPDDDALPTGVAHPPVSPASDSLAAPSSNGRSSSGVRDNGHTDIRQPQTPSDDINARIPPNHVEMGEGFGYSIMLDHPRLNSFRDEIHRRVRADFGRDVADIVDDQVGKVLGSRHVTRGMLEDLMSGVRITVPSRRLGGLRNGTIQIELQASLFYAGNLGLSEEEHVLERAHSAGVVDSWSVGTSRANTGSFDVTFVHPRPTSATHEHDVDLVVAVNAQSGISYSDTLDIQDSLGLLAVTKVVRFGYHVDMTARIRVDSAPSMLVNALTMDRVRGRSSTTRARLLYANSLVLGFPEEVTLRPTQTQPDQDGVGADITGGRPGTADRTAVVPADIAHQHAGVFQRRHLEDAEIDSDVFGGLRRLRQVAIRDLFGDVGPTSWEGNLVHLHSMVETLASPAYLARNFVPLLTGSMSYPNVIPGVALPVSGRLGFSIDLDGMTVLHRNVSPNRDVVGGLVKDFRQVGSTVRSSASRGFNLTVTGAYRPVFAPFLGVDPSVRRHGDSHGHQFRVAGQPIAHAASVSAAGPSTSLQQGNKTTKRSHNLIVANVTYRMSWTPDGADTATVVVVRAPGAVRLWIPQEQSELLERTALVANLSAPSEYSVQSESDESVDSPEPVGPSPLSEPSSLPSEYSVEPGSDGRVETPRPVEHSPSSESSSLPSVYSVQPGSDGGVETPGQVGYSPSSVYSPSPSVYSVQQGSDRRADTPRPEEYSPSSERLSLPSVYSVSPPSEHAPSPEPEPGPVVPVVTSQADLWAEHDELADLATAVGGHTGRSTHLALDDIADRIRAVTGQPDIDAIARALDQWRQDLAAIDVDRDHYPRDASMRATVQDRLIAHQRAASRWLSAPGMLGVGEQEHQVRNHVAAVMAWAEDPLYIQERARDLLIAGLRRLRPVPGDAYQAVSLTAADIEGMVPGTIFTMEQPDTALADRPTLDHSTVIVLRHRSGRPMAPVMGDGDHRIAFLPDTLFRVESASPSEIVMVETTPADLRRAEERQREEAPDVATPPQPSPSVTDDRSTPVDMPAVRPVDPPADHQHIPGDTATSPGESSVEGAASPGGRSGDALDLLVLYGVDDAVRRIAPSPASVLASLSEDVREVLETDTMEAAQQVANDIMLALETFAGRNELRDLLSLPPEEIRQRVRGVRLERGPQQ